jgi:hypothetical protein
MSADLIPLVCALIASLTALGIALQNRPWIKQDRRADEATAVERLRLSAQLETRRAAAKALFEFDSCTCPVSSSGSGAGWNDFAEDIKNGMRAVETYRRWAATLPLVWRIRIDGQLSSFAHFGHASVARQLQSDIADLLNGEERPSAMDPRTRDVFLAYLMALFHSSRYQLDRKLATLTKPILAVMMELPRPQDQEHAEAAHLIDAVTGQAPLALPA